MSIRELFRKKLEKAEIIPEASFNAVLMRRLARKEFMRFNPARLNIYYLGGVLVAGIAAAIIMISGPGKSERMIHFNPSYDTLKTDTIRYLNVPSEKIIIQKSEKPHTGVSKTLTDSMKPQKIAGIVREPARESEDKRNDNVIHADINDNFTKNGLFPDAAVSKNKLQGKALSGEDLFEPSVMGGCPPLKLHFHSKVNSYDSCRWTFGDGGYSDQKNPDWIFDVEGEYKVVLQVFSSDGLQATASVIITVYPKPHAYFEIYPEKAIIPDDEIRFLNYSVNADHFVWDFGDGDTSELFEPRHRYSKFSNYNVRLVASSEYGCSDSLTVMNAFSGSEYYIDFPNAFIPNAEGPTGGFYSSKSDEAAQVFHPSFSGVSDYQLKIFSKIGILIFETNDINIGWDGYFKGQLSNPGVYIWKVRGSFRNGEPFIKMGDVTLLGN